MLVLLVVGSTFVIYRRAISTRKATSCRSFNQMRELGCANSTLSSLFLTTVVATHLEMSKFVRRPIFDVEVIPFLSEDFHSTSQEAHSETQASTNLSQAAFEFQLACL